jgi:hypothetical protein
MLGVGYGELTDQQCMTLLKDVADAVRGLVTPDWVTPQILLSPAAWSHSMAPS